MFAVKLFIVLLLIHQCIPVITAATIHGTVYEWSTFDPLDNALVELNTTPVQFRVATSGIYSFNLPTGEYFIKTSYYEHDILKYYSEDVITVTDNDGDYVLDILLFPIDEESEEEILPEKDITNLTSDINQENTLPKFGWTYTGVAIIILIIAVALAYFHYKSRGSRNIGFQDETLSTKTENNEQNQEKDNQLPDDLKEIIEILKKSEGRITQKELRMKLRSSEAKVSLMIADLESRGLIQKIKKGRGNIILLRTGLIL